jgi:hypothetical protein
MEFLFLVELKNVPIILDHQKFKYHNTQNLKIKEMSLFSFKI